jgi:parallel beta-helix repeat protein
MEGVFRILRPVSDHTGKGTMSRPRRALWRISVAALAATFVLAAPAAAVTRTVQPGESIQAAIDASQPGDRIGLRDAEYRESLEIRTDGLTLEGNGATLAQPASPATTLCNEDPAATAGICVVGQLDFSGGQEPRVIEPVHDVRIEDLTVRAFTGDGVFGFGTEDLRLEETRLLDNGGYGAFSLMGTGTHFLESVAQGNGGPGFYVGDSPNAQAVLRDNRATENAGEGILLRSASFGRVTDNELSGNCAGLLVLADAPGPASDWTIRDNEVEANNLACAGEPDEGEPPVSGVGIALLGVANSRVAHNEVEGNLALNPSFVSGGIAVVAGPEGTPPQGITIRRNDAFGNTPSDLFWDESGTVAFKKNRCGTSTPDGLCRDADDNGDDD